MSSIFLFVSIFRLYTLTLTLIVAIFTVIREKLKFESNLKEVVPDFLLPRDCLLKLPLVIIGYHVSYDEC